MKKDNLIMVGIDVSKHTLDVCIDGKSVRSYENNAKGHRQIKDAIEPHP